MAISRRAITTMQVRGAPAIGVAAAYGLVLGAQAHSTLKPGAFVADLDRFATMLRSTRPTAVNLNWAIDRMTARGRAVAEASGVQAAQTALLSLADEMAEEDIAVNKRIGAF